MNIQLYINKSDVRALNKNITLLSEANVILKDSTDIMRPIIQLASAELPPGANYCYIPDFKRYYFISAQNIQPGKLLQIRLDVDVLMSFKDEVNSAQVVAVKSSNKFNRYLTDDIPTLNMQNNIFKAFTPFQGLLPFDSGAVNGATPCILLTVLKGGKTS